MQFIAIASVKNIQITGYVSQHSLFAEQCNRIEQQFNLKINIKLKFVCFVYLTHLPCNACAIVAFDLGHKMISTFEWATSKSFVALLIVLLMLMDFYTRTLHHRMANISFHLFNRTLLLAFILLAINKNASKQMIFNFTAV